MSHCQSVKNKTHRFEPCPQKALLGEKFCKKHANQKEKILFDPSVLNPLSSDNDCDPVLMEPIYKIIEDPKKGQVKKLASRSPLFTYIMESGGKSYQRSLYLTTIRDMMKNNILIDPFSNIPLPEEVISQARKEISRKAPTSKRLSRSEEQSIRFTTILEKFQTIGFIIDPIMVTRQGKHFYLEWYHEVQHFWNKFRYEYPDIASCVYGSATITPVNPQASRPEVIRQVTTNILQFMSLSDMGIMIVVNALAWVCEAVGRAYPDLLSS
jgi:hypothetical protein